MLAGDLDPRQRRSADPAAAEPAVNTTVQRLEEAAQWYATLCDDKVSEKDYAAWRAWLAESPEHAGAWQHIEAVSRRFAPLRTAHEGGAGGTAAALAGVNAARRRRVAKGLAGVLGLGVAGWLGWRSTPLPQYVAALRADFHTGTGEQREWVLADGSRVWLNTRSAVQVYYGDAMRRLGLLAGEMLIETAQDPQQRPFYVHTRFGRMQALGTRFNVRLAEDQTRLDVFEGTVEIVTQSGESKRVGAGQAALFTAAGVMPQGAADRVREAWCTARLPADDMPLGELLAELARYRHGHISVAPAVAGLKVMGVYPLDDTDRALAMLAQSLPIRVRHTLPWWTTVEAR